MFNPVLGPIALPTANILVKCAGNFAVPNNANTNVVFDTNVWGSGLTWATTSITCVTPGKYQVSSNVLWDINGTTGIRQCDVYHYNSSLVQKRALGARCVPTLSGYLQTSVSGTLNLAAGDIVRMIAYQNQGVSVNLIVCELTLCIIPGQ